VSGVDLDLSFLVADNWTADLAFNYSDGDFDNVAVPCRDTNFDGNADGGPNPRVWPSPSSTAVPNPPQGPVAFCVSDDPIATTPDWSATLQSDYTLPRGSLEYYARGLLNYQPGNSNVQTYWERDSFATLNLFLGVRTAEPGWDVSLWAKNLFDDDTTLNLSQEQTYNGFNSGYYLVQVQPERQIGMTLSYTFGGG
jgi:iron complex outermembrane receptor protein